MEKMSDSQVDFSLDEVWKKIFKMLDVNSDGAIMARDLRTIMHKHGFDMTELEARKLITKIDKHGRGVVDEEDFIVHMKMSFGTLRKDLLKLFENMDTNKRGYLLPEELYQGLLRLGVDVDEEEFQEIMKIIDVSQNGQISFEEFVNAMM